MKQSLLFLALIAGAGLADANSAGGFQAQGEVVRSTPIYESFNDPRRECWNEQVGIEAPRDRSYGGAVLGGLFGGLIGHQMGRGSGRDWGTAVGAATGAIVGDNIDNDGRRAMAGGPRYEQRCRQVDNWSRRLTGYNVTYRFEGQTFTTTLPYDPGPTVRLNVSVSVADR